MQTAVVTVAIMIRGTAKDLARESAAREQAEKATEARLVIIEREDTPARRRAARSRASPRSERTRAGCGGGNVAQQAQALAALSKPRADDRRRR
ncbi:MAG: hypothetical protein HYV09_13020 [Deltaproteobacteria bacterium]|nr:hypothetical protein [Deltaproteobacteria bacterium]